MNPTKKLFLIRHSESEKNILGLNSKQNSTWGLTVMGRNQAKRIASFFANKICNVSYSIFSNNEPRVLETATIIASALKMKLNNFDLASIRVGRVAGMNNDDFAKEFPFEFDKEMQFKNGTLTGYELLYPGGESIIEFQGRTMHELFKYCREQIEDYLLVVTNQSVIAAIINYFENDGIKGYYKFIKLDYLQVTEMSIDSIREKVNRLKYHFL